MTHCAGRCEAIWVTISHGKDRRLLPWLEGEGLVSTALADGSKLNLCQNAQVWNIQSSRTDMSPCSQRWSITMIYYSDCFNTDLSGKEWGVSWQVKLGGPAPAGASLLLLVLQGDACSRHRLNHKSINWCWHHLLSFTFVVNPFTLNRLILHMCPWLPVSWNGNIMFFLAK